MVVQFLLQNVIGMFKVYQLETKPVNSKSSEEMHVNVVRNTTTVVIKSTHSLRHRDTSEIFTISARCRWLLAKPCSLIINSVLDTRFD